MKINKFKGWFNSKTIKDIDAQELKWEWSGTVRAFKDYKNEILFGNSKEDNFYEDIEGLNTEATIETIKPILDYSNLLLKEILSRKELSFNRTRMSSEATELLSLYLKEKKLKDIFPENNIETLVNKKEGSFECSVQVLYKENNIYDVGYALDSAKPRSGDNIVLTKRIKSEFEIEENSIITLKCEGVKPFKENKYWKINFINPIVTDVNKGRKKPDTVREILHKAETLDLIDMDSIIQKELISLKLLTAKRENSISLIKANNKKKQIVYGIVYEPDVIDSHNDFSNAEEIEKASHNYLANFSNTKVMHELDANNRAKVVESYIAPVDFSMGNQKIKKGSWVMAMHIIDKSLWNLVEAGKINAFSMGGQAQQGES